MLVLTRNIGQTIVIGDEIWMSVLGVKGGVVRLGIDAPVHIPVHREEIYLKVQQASLMKEWDKNSHPSNHLLQSH